MSELFSYNKFVRLSQSINIQSTNDLNAGTYVYTLNVDGLRQSNKFIVTK